MHIRNGVTVRARSSSPRRQESQRNSAGSGIIVTWPRASSRESECQQSVPQGDVFRFAISDRQCAIDPESATPVGSFQASASFWMISNFTASTTFAVENLEGGTELVKIPPRRVEVPIPFELSRVVVPYGLHVVEMKVFGPRPKVIEQPLQNDPEIFAINLDINSKYFKVLLALCEPRLRGNTMAAVPSVQEVLQRLRQSADFRSATRSSINYHIDYLRVVKLPVSGPAASLRDGRLHSKREALVYFALRHDLVREEHLALLPPMQWRSQTYSPNIPMLYRMCRCPGWKFTSI